jgi:hypothetical protein
MPEMASVIQRHQPVVLIETGGENRREIIDLFSGWGYKGYVVMNGKLVPLTTAPEKDIVFIPENQSVEDYIAL